MTNEEKKIILTNLKTTLFMCEEVSRDAMNEANRLLNGLFESDTKCSEKVKMKKAGNLKC